MSVEKYNDQNEDQKIIHHRRTNPFVQIDKGIINDERLTWKPKGIMVYLCSQADGWQFYAKEITKHSKDKIDSTESGLKELEKYGYLIRIRRRDSKGRYRGRDWHVFETPIPVEKIEEVKQKLINQSALEDKECLNNGDPPKTGKSNLGETNLGGPDAGEPDIGESNLGKTNLGESNSGESKTNNNNLNDNNLSNNNSNDDDEDFFIKNKKEIIEFEKYTELKMNRARLKRYKIWRVDWKFSKDEVFRAAEMALLNANNIYSYIDETLSDWLQRKRERKQ